VRRAEVETRVVAIEAPESATEEAASTTERRSRKMGWLWAALAGATVGGAAVWFATGISREPPLERTIAPAAPVAENDEASLTRDAAEQAGVAAIPEIPLPLEEPVTAAIAEQAPPPAVVSAPPPRLPRATSASDPVPTVVPEPDEPPVEDVAVATPEPSVAPVPAEPAAQPGPVAQPAVEAPVEIEVPFASVDDVDVAPMPRQRDLPRYTRRARRLQQEGEVKLRIEIDSHGDVAEVVLLSGIPDSDLNEAAVEVARGWTFSPARKDGRRVSVLKDVEFEFTVRPDRTTSVRIRE
jgi:protein TonB